MAANPNLGHTQDERRVSLGRAVAARRARMEAKDRMRAGEISPVELIGQCGEDEFLGRMPVRQFLMALPGIGAARSRRIMAELGIAEDRRMGGIGRRQRERLVTWCEGLERKDECEAPEE